MEKLKAKLDAWWGCIKAKYVKFKTKLGIMVTFGFWPND